MALLDALGVAHPIFLAPMAGGPGTPELAAAVANAGGLGFLGGGYLAPDALRAEIRRVRALSRGPFGVNLFAGGYHETTDRDPTPMLDLMASVHAELGLAAPSVPAVPPDPFRAQLAVVLEERPAAFSFTFGIPEAASIRALRDANIVILGTATAVDEALALEAARVDAIVAQGAEAGAHRGTFLGRAEEWMVPTFDLVRAIRARTNVPIVASGGIMTGGDIAEALRAGAVAVQMGTAFLTCDEAGTSKPYHDALLHANERESVLTRAYSGRHARGLRNRFIDRVGERDALILPYPIQNSLTRPMRTAAAKQDNPEYLSLWAGTGVARVRPMPAKALLETLVRELRQALS